MADIVVKQVTRNITVHQVGRRGQQGIQGPQGDPATNLVTSVNGRQGAVTGLAENSDLIAHTTDTTNPHAVTKAQVGLGNVPNVDATQRANHTGTQPISTIVSLQASLDAKANDSTVVHLTGNESISGIKTFSSSPVVPSPSVDTDAANKLYVDTQIAGVEGSDVDSFNGRTGAVLPLAGDYTATLITNTPAGSIASTTVQAAINELDSEKESSIATGTTLQYYRGDKTWQTLNTSVVPESGNLYYTNTRSRAAISGTANQVLYDSSTGVLSLPQNIHTAATPTFSTVTATGGTSQFASITLTTVQPIPLTITNTAASGSGGGAGIVAVSNDGAALASGDRMGYMLFGGNYDAVSSSNSAGITTYTTEAWSASNRGSMIALEYIAVGSNVRRQGVRIGDASVSSVLYAVGESSSSSNYAFRAVNSGGTELLNLRNDALIGIRTSAATHTVTLGSLSTGIVQYATADQVTNYERFRTFWSASVLTMAIETSGTGTQRNMNLSANNTLFELGLISNIASRISRASTSVAVSLFDVTTTGTGLTTASGNQAAMRINPTITQGGTGSATMLLVDPTVSSLGSGGLLLADFRVGGSSKFSISNTGVTTVVGVINANSGIFVSNGSNLSFGTSVGTKIGSATNQMLAFWNATPIVQPTTAVAAATFVANTSGIVNDTATFDGYTIGQVVKALRNAGLLA